MTETTTPTPAQMRLYARMLRLDASGEAGRMDATHMYAVADALDAIAASALDAKGETTGEEGDGYDGVIRARNYFAAPPLAPSSEPEDEDDVDENALKPCPFCGGEASIFEVEETDNKGGYVAGCNKCEASTRVWFPIKDSVTRQLTEAWNRRASAPREPQPSSEPTCGREGCPGCVKCNWPSSEASAPLLAEIRQAMADCDDAFIWGTLNSCLRALKGTD